MLIQRISSLTIAGKGGSGLLLRSLEIAEEQLGGRHPNTAVSLNNLALLYQDQGKHKEAGPLLVCALEIREQTLGPVHPDTATSL